MCIKHRDFESRCQIISYITQPPQIAWLDKLPPVLREGSSILAGFLQKSGHQVFFLLKIFKR